MRTQRDWDYAEYLFDAMKDDFLMIENEHDAKICINRYPKQASMYLPKKYMHLLKTKRKRGKN